jgi:hypothetical protein
MSPAGKFHAIVVSLTAVVVFALAAWLKPVVDQAATQNQSLATLAKVLSTVGAYALLGKGVSLVLEKLPLFRRFVFGRTYLHGTWVGYFVGHAGDKRWTVETFIQTLYDLRINGRSYDASGKLHATWKVLATRVDGQDGTMVFAYEMDILSRTEPVRGITTIQLDYDAKTGRPCALSGLAQDLADSVRIAIQEEKWVDTGKSFDEALQEARKRFP